jgi:hypothetical protein
VHVALKLPQFPPRHSSSIVLHAAQSMLISRDRKLLFVHVQKTGGTSIAHMLRQALPDAQEILGTHDHARWAKRELGSEYGGLFKFAFVRNPWARLVSWYEMIVQNSGPESAVAPNRLWSYVVSSSSSFEEFILRCTETIDDVDGRKSFLYNQLDYITDDAGNVIVDFVGRFEHLVGDVGKVFAKLGLPFEAMPHTNPSKHLHYSEYYTPGTREVVAKRFARDIAFFGYRFETAADATSGR